MTPAQTDSLRRRRCHRALTPLSVLLFATPPLPRHVGVYQWLTGAQRHANSQPPAANYSRLTALPGDEGCRVLVRGVTVPCIGGGGLPRLEAAAVVEEREEEEEEKSSLSASGQGGTIDWSRPGNWLGPSSCLPSYLPAAAAASSSSSSRQVVRKLPRLSGGPRGSRALSTSHRVLAQHGAPRDRSTKPRLYQRKVLLRPHYEPPHLLRRPGA